MGNSIFLIGLPGSGKTSVGKLLAMRIGYGFSDSDEAALGLVREDFPSITTLLEMYATLGNPEFRRYEELALRDLATQAGRVVATGGGFVEHPGSFDLVSRLAKVVWLDCGIDMLTTRISAMPARPMFQKLGIRATLEKLESERVGKYQNLAKLRVDAKRECPQIVDNIIAALSL